jgi:hypothetical protein
MDDSSEIMVERNGNRFRLTDSPRDGKFSMVGIVEDIPHYIAKLQTLAISPRDPAQKEFGRRVYFPVTAATLAVQWDGSEVTYMYLNSISRMRGCFATYKEGMSKVNIAMMGDYQGGVDYAIGDWAVFEPSQKHVTHWTDEQFKVRYTKASLEG